MTELTDDTFGEAIHESGGVILVDFWAPWCGPCRQMSPIFDQVSSELEVTGYKVNVDDNPVVQASTGVMSIPTVHAYKDGELIGSQVGAVSKAAFTNWVSQFI